MLTEASNHERMMCDTHGCQHTSHQEGANANATDSQQVQSPTCSRANMLTCYIKTVNIVNGVK